MVKTKTKTTCKLSQLFHIQYGNSLELIYLKKKADGINFVSRTAKRNGVSSKVERLALVQPFPAGLITVAVSGSVLETFLQPSPFYTGFHVMVLTPRIEMSSAVKLYYCQCIRENQYKYNYGRQANATLAYLEVPKIEYIPQYVRNFSLKEYGKDLIGQLAVPTADGRCAEKSALLPLKNLFIIKNGIASSQVMRRKEKENENWIPFVRPSYRQETSVAAYVNKKAVPQEKIFPAETLYVSTNGQGSHTFSYVSIFEFVPNSDISVLIPKRKMGLQEKLFYAQCITNNRYKFSYGRKPKGVRLGQIALPEYPPEYVFQYSIDAAIKDFNCIINTT